MKNEFVPYDRALKLKELGFVEPCFAVFELIVVGDTIPKFRYNWESEDKWFNHNKDKSEYKDHDWYWSAPLYQQAFRWFRENYSWTIKVNQVTKSNWSYTLDNFPKDRTYYGEVYKTYEEAELACLDKLIEILENKID